MEGVIRTRVGYTGGTRVNPTYHALGDHSEAVEIDFDPSVISYSELLEIFWRSHDPGSRSWSRQYRAAIFYHDEEQKRLALESMKTQEARTGKVYTEVLPAATFYRAEDYHQKYYLRQRPDLLRELEGIYPRGNDLVDSTAAARANGYLAGNGSCAVAQTALESLLPPEKGRRFSEALCGSR
jgi:peptide-methionine (S)-S-oxide reductase